MTIENTGIILHDISVFSVVGNMCFENVDILLNQKNISNAIELLTMLVGVIFYKDITNGN